MSRATSRISASRVPKRPLSAVWAIAIAVATLVAFTGCDELSARRTIQRGDKLYAQAKYRDAVAEYEKALELSELEVGRHNAGLAYYRLFTPGDPSTENKEWAVKSTEHFLKYLESNPNDKKVVRLVTQVWLDSDQYKKALDYWEAIRAKNPSDPSVLAELANINRAAGNHQVAIDWLLKRVEVESDDAGKVSAYMDIANVQYSRLTKQDLVDDERLAVADSALSALESATKLNPDNPQLAGLTAVVFQFRALSHGASWARTVEAASQRYYNLEARKKSAAQSGASKKPEAPGKPDPKPGEKK